ncbi:MAG: hypothetical protein WDZ51_04245 [Pirellulaceae bacterium]
MQFLLIIALSIASAVIYGILHDQITARVCVEYFTIGHPPVFNTEDPTLLGLGWGIIATWWVGVILGVGLAMVARIGRRPKRSPKSLIRPIGILMAIMAVFAITAGIAGYTAGSLGWVFLVGHIAETVPPEKHVPFLADMWAHSASYLVGFVGGIVVMVRVWMSRGTMARLKDEG